MAIPLIFKYVDSHAHAYEYDESYLKKLRGDYLILSVSEDLESSKKNLALAQEHGFLIPCIGIHPWKIETANSESLREIEKLLSEMDRPCLGEVGLDRKFVPQTYEMQLEVFEKFLKMAREIGAALNLHSAGAWREVYDYVAKSDVSRAVFHWYTGPLDVMNAVQDAGFYISFNVAARFQKKHSELLKHADLKRVLTESDGPYNYRGELLSTEKIPLLIDFMSEALGIERENLRKKISENILSFLR